MQILRGAPATLELQVFQSGVLTNLDANPTVVLTDSNGTVVSSGSVTSPSVGIYQAVLSGQPDLKTIKAVWTGVLSGDPVSFTQYYEIVGNLLFTVAEARGARFTGQQAPLSDEAKFPDEVIARIREEVSDAFEEKTDRSWITRYCRTELHGDGSREISLYRGHARDVDGNQSGGPRRLWDIRRIISVTVNDDPHTDFELHGRRIINTSGRWPRASMSNPFNITVEYEYGSDPVPFEARENGLRVAVSTLVPSDVPDYAQTLSVGGENYSFQQHAELLGSLRVWPERTREWLSRYPPRRIPVVA